MYIYLFIYLDSFDLSDKNENEKREIAIIKELKLVMLCHCHALDVSLTICFLILFFISHYFFYPDLLVKERKRLSFLLLLNARILNFISKTKATKERLYSCYRVEICIKY
jgi:hypothetical protein